MTFSSTMAPVTGKRVVTLAFVCILAFTIADDEIPEVTIQALNPRGVRISIPAIQGVNTFIFNGNINRKIEIDDVGTITAEVTKSMRWTFQDDEVELKVGDVIYYYVRIVKNRKMYQKENLSYTVTELVDPHATKPGPKQQPAITAMPTSTPTSRPSDCRPTSTVVQGVTACSGQIIFEDNFDKSLEEKWTIEQYIPSAPDYPYVSYQRPPNGPTVSVQNGALSIEPKLQERLPGFEDEDHIISENNKLDLMSGCTKPGACVYINKGSKIMPPIASGRVTSKFAFKYGLIEVRAKLPIGDWLYPDLLLESLSNKYGADNYHSGVLRIAGALGNVVLIKDSEDVGNKVLYGGPIMDFDCRTQLQDKKQSIDGWGNDFHNYSLRWAPDSITLLVDGTIWGRKEPTANGFKGLLSKECNVPRTFLNDPMAPFDDFFNIALGVAAGGISEFPDLTLSVNSAPKPWKNSSSKARKAFYYDKNTWSSTWEQPTLLVDYVRVRAL